MPQAAELLAEDLVRARLGRREPQVRDHARHQVHLHAELRHREVVQDVLRAQQHLDGLVERQVQLRAGDQDVVLAARIVRIHAERVVGADERRIDGAQHAVLARQAEAPGPLLAERFDHRRVLGHGDELGPDDQARRQHRDDADRGQPDQPPLELLVLGLVFRAALAALAVPVADDRVGHEQVHGDEHGAGDPEGEVDGVVHQSPVRRDRREPPRVQEMERDGSDHQQHERDRDRHASTPSAGAGRPADRSASLA